MTTTERETMPKPTRQLVVKKLTPVKSGVTRWQKPWTLSKVQAEANGQPIEHDLVTFADLPLDVEIEVEVERREREFRGKTYVSFALSLPKQEKLTQPALPLVPDGRYAVTLAGEVQLFRVWRGTRDPSQQHVYSVKGTEDGERVRGQMETDAVLEIAADPGKAAQEFGRRTGSCSRCGEKLKKNLSRKLAIGPVCMKHWFDDETRAEMKKTARSELRAAGLDPEALYDDLAAA